MQDKGMDFRKKEVINITDGRRLRLCSRCVCRFRHWQNNIYNCALIENRYNSFEFDREIVRKGYVTRKNKSMYFIIYNCY